MQTDEMIDNERGLTIDVIFANNLKFFSECYLHMFIITTVYIFKLVK